MRNELIKMRIKLSDCSIDVSRRLANSYVCFASVMDASCRLNMVVLGHRCIKLYGII